MLARKGLTRGNDLWRSATRLPLPGAGKQRSRGEDGQGRLLTLSRSPG